MNNIVIGIESGIDFTTESNKVIIGDGIKNLDPEDKKDCVIFRGKGNEVNMIVGKYVGGVRCNLYDILKAVRDGN